MHYISTLETFFSLLKQIHIGHSTLQMFTGHYGSFQVFLVLGKPCNIHRLRRNPIIIMGFPTICKYYRVYPQHTQGFFVILTSLFHRQCRFSLQGPCNSMAPQDFGRSVNPISTKGDKLCPPCNTNFQTFLRPWLFFFSFS